jgi:TonB family protein
MVQNPVVHNPVVQSQIVPNQIVQNQVAQNGADQNEGIHQVLPEVPQKARDTIRGTVRVSVKVSVDPTGHVADAALDTPGPSRYFANLALKAAQQWTFGTATGSDANTVREWILNFAFSPIDTQVRSVRKAPQ